MISHIACEIDDPMMSWARTSKFRLNRSWKSTPHASAWRDFYSSFHKPYHSRIIELFFWGWPPAYVLFFTLRFIFPLRSHISWRRSSLRCLADIRWPAKKGVWTASLNSTQPYKVFKKNCNHCAPPLSLLTHSFASLPTIILGTGIPPMDNGLSGGTHLKRTKMTNLSPTQIWKHNYRRWQCLSVLFSLSENIRLCIQSPPGYSYMRSGVLISYVFERRRDLACFRSWPWHTCTKHDKGTIVFKV